MSFPQTRQTLIERLAHRGSSRDWQEFLADYWGPVCRFALRRNGTSLQDAEDVAASTFEIVYCNQLLKRWFHSQQAKLRTLLCSVAWKVQSGQLRKLQRHGNVVLRLAEDAFDIAAHNENSLHEELFLSAWIQDLLQHCLLQLAEDYHAEGKGDYFRVFYGRLCESLSIAEVADTLEISLAAVSNYYRNVRKRLEERLASAVRSQVYRYCRPEEAEAEFQNEWNCLAEHLLKHGGLDAAVRNAHEAIELRHLLLPKVSMIDLDGKLPED